MEIHFLGFPPLFLLAVLPGVLSILFGLVSFFLLLEVPSGRWTLMLSWAVSIWAFGYAFTVKAQAPPEALFWARVSTAGLLFFPALLYLFNASFVKPESLSHRLKLLLFLLVLGFQAVHWSTSLFVPGVQRLSWGYWPRYGPFFVIFCVSFVTTFYIILRDTWQHFRRTAKGPIRSRDRTLLLTWFFCFCGVSDVLIGFGVPLPPMSFVPVTCFILAAFWLLLRYGMLGFLQHWSLESILQSTADSVFLTHRDGTLSRLDRQTVTTLGYSSPDDLKGRAVNDFFSPRTPFHSKHVVSRLGQGRSPESFYLELRPRSGDGIPMRMRLSGIFNRRGELLGILGIGRDMRGEIERNEELRKANLSLLEKIAEVEERTSQLALANRDLEENRSALMDVLKDMEDSQKKLEEAYQRLAEIDQTKDAFLSSVSHELRTPLSSIRSFSELLIQYPDEAEETQKEFLWIIHQESERLTRLVNDLLDLSKIESGKQQWRDEKVDIREVLLAVHQNSSVLAKDKNLSVTISAKEGLPALFLDRDRIYQVISNLFTNAVKFTPPGGSISLLAELVEKGEPKDGGKPLLAVRVSDTGIGIPKKELRRIFEKFHQAGDTLKDKPKGTGLGLAICREIVQHYGGQIWAESKPGEGSCLCLTLPLPSLPAERARRFRQDAGETSGPPVLARPHNSGENGEEVSVESFETFPG